MAPLVLLALAGVLALVLVIPTRRLFLAGWSQRVLVTYFVGMLALAMAALVLRGPARFLVPILIIGFLAPFVTLGPGLERLLRRGRSVQQDPLPADPPIKDVTPPEERADGDSGAERPDA